MKSFLPFLALLFFVSACETTPYDIKPNHCKGLTIQSQIEKLKAKENLHPQKKVFRVALIGDPQTNPEGMRDAIERVNTRTDIDFVMILGDLSDTGLEMEYDWVCVSLKKLKIPFFTVIGNHDALSNGKQIWSQNFGPFDYSFSYLGTKFITYNDNAYEFANVPNMNFLQQEAVVKPGETRYHTIGASHIAPIVEAHQLDHVIRFLKSLNHLNITHTVHAHKHSFDYDQDRHGNGHYVVSDTKGSEWGLMSISQTEIRMENCVGHICSIVTPK